MAKQLYDYWFVQFDFPDENGKPYKSSGGKMVWNEKLKREIPEGWNVCRLSEFVSKNNAGDWGTDDPFENSIEIGCIRGADITKLNNLPKRYIKSSNRAKILSVWDVVIEVSGGSPIQATGRSAFITSGVIERNGGQITCSNFCHAFSFKDYRESAYFFYIWKMFYDNGIMFNYEGKTSGIKNFMTETFLANKWVKAPKDLIYKFFDTIKSVYSKIDANITESNDLIKLRDSLLPLLMNGQVSVNYDLESLVSQLHDVEKAIFANHRGRQVTKFVYICASETCARERYWNFAEKAAHFLSKIVRFSAQVVELSPPLGAEPLPPQQRAPNLRPSRHLTARQPAAHALFITWGTRHYRKRHTPYIIRTHTQSGRQPCTLALLRRPHAPPADCTTVGTATEARKLPPSSHPPTVHRL